MIKDCDRLTKHVRSVSNNIPVISIDEPNEASGANKMNLHHLNLRIINATKEKIDKTKLLE